MDRELVADLKVRSEGQTCKVAWVVNQSHPSSSQEPSHRTVGTCPTHRTEKEKRKELKKSLLPQESRLGATERTSWSYIDSYQVHERASWLSVKSCHGKADVVTEVEYGDLVKYKKECRD